MRERNRTQNFPASYVGRGSYEPYVMNPIEEQII